MVAFLDIQGAFNNITPNAIDYALANLMVGVDLKWLTNMVLTRRRATAKLGTSISTRYVNRGTPQGGVLSPLLQNFALNVILVTLENGDGKVVAYVDDVAIAVLAHLG